MNSYFGQLRKKDGKLIHTSRSAADLYADFVANIPDGALIEVYSQAITADGSLAQLATVHALIRRLAAHIGEDPARIKTLVKDRAGLCFTRTDRSISELFCKSFGDCSHDDLHLAIRAAIDIGKEVNLNLL